MIHENYSTKIERKSWKELCVEHESLVNKVKNSRWLFRGQKDQAMDLKTSFDRLIEKIELGSYDFLARDLNAQRLCKSLQSNKKKSDTLVFEKLATTIANLNQVKEKDYAIAFNEILKTPDFYTRVDIGKYKLNLPLEIQKLLKTVLASGKKLNEVEGLKLNKALLQVIYPCKIRRSLKLKNIDRQKLECSLVEKFIRECRIHVQRTPGIYDLPEWFSLMQHYGVPTRLLDCTYSFYVAAFFALEDFECGEDAVVWAINYKGLDEKLPDKLKPVLQFKDRHLQKNTNFKKIIKKSLVLRLNPYYLHERLLVQQGCFLMPGNVNETFIDNLLNFIKPNVLKKNLYKFIIKRNIQKEILEDLIRMNISRSSLFPGLDGFSASLKSLSFVNPHIVMYGTRCGSGEKCKKHSKSDCVFSC